MSEPEKKLYYDPLSVARRTKQKVYFVAQHDKMAMLEQLLKEGTFKQMLIITKSKRSADEVSRFLVGLNFKAMCIHGNHRAEDKNAALKAFNSAETDILITTDMILQSLELGTISFMLGYDLPLETEHYFNRLGYLQEIGESISFVSPEDEILLSSIEHKIKIEISEEELQDFIPTPFDEKASLTSQKDKKKKPRHRSQKHKKVRKTKEE